MSLRSALALCLPNIPRHLLPGGFDTVGDIALLTLPHAIRPQASRIGKAILSLHAHIRVVALRHGEYSGVHRLVSLQVIAGEQRLSTVHRENGLSLHLDLATCFFSTRMAEERLRVARLVQAGERVCVLCSGAGPYPLGIARHSQAREVHGIEINPAAHAHGLRNVQANNYTKKVYLHAGEAGTVLVALNQLFDRIVIVLPRDAGSLLAAALAHLRPGGALHCYAMESQKDKSSFIEQLSTLCTAKNRRMHHVRSVRCGHCGPGVYRICHDTVIGAS